ncbi:hypothetical protein [Streptomyces sp. NPDC046870]|uniref:hypothetical protein n=1 Tax=Streptomyces sp. NPDC046870 TaxID=3155135 RepID=UPI0034566E5E
MLKGMRTRAGMVLGTLGLATAATLITAGPALASGSVCATTCASEVNFTSDGEYFTVHDYASDGKSAVGDLQYYYNGSWHDEGWVWNSNGYSGSPVTKNYSIGEGVEVAYIACFGHASTGEIFDCGDWHYDTA